MKMPVFRIAKTCQTAVCIQFIFVIIDYIRYVIYERSAYR